MLLTITSTAPTAPDLGYLLHKHPGRVHRFALSVGEAHVFYPTADERRCTAALLLEVDPVGLVRGRNGAGGAGFSLGQYVNDRPYAASSLLAVALGRVFRTAMAGRCEARPELPGRALPLEIHIPALPCDGDISVAQRTFVPLGWSVRATPIPLDPAVPAWGPSRYVDLRLTGELRLADALNHLYVLLPVLDDAKHYWVGTDEVDKLVRAGQGWLSDHPDRDLIMKRYLAHQRPLVRTAVDRLAEADDTEPETLDNGVTDPDIGDELRAAPALPPLADQRISAVLAAVRAAGAARVLDLGSGEGRLIRHLLAEPAVTQVLGVDVSAQALQRAAQRLRLDRLPERQQDRLSLLQSSLTYRDARIAGYDAAVLMEVIEHVDPPRLPALERTVFGHARPGMVIVTTPNREYNVRYPRLATGTLRHRDHRFEWTRAQFRTWADGVADAYGYPVRLQPIGSEDPDLGPPTQMAVFTRREAP